MSEKTMLEKVKGAVGHLFVSAVVTFVLTLLGGGFLSPVVPVAFYGGREHESESRKLQDAGMKRKQAEKRAVMMTLVKPDFWMAPVGAGVGLAALRFIT